MSSLFGVSVQRVEADRLIVKLGAAGVRAGVGVYADAGWSPPSRNGNGMRIENRSPR